MQVHSDCRSPRELQLHRVAGFTGAGNYLGPHVPRQGAVHRYGRRVLRVSACVRASRRGRRA